MLLDLNVEWPQKSFVESVDEKDISRVRATLGTLFTLGYTHVALNFTVSHSEKFPNNINEMNKMQIQENFGEFMKETGMKIYSRVTLIIDDPSKGQSLSKISQAYDIVAALPISERGLTLATTSLEIDILTFNYGQQFPTFLKHKSICNCVNRGVKVEIVYGYGLRDIQARRRFIQNVRSVIRSSRSRGIIISSGAQNALECRNIIGVSSLIKTLGLPSDKCSRAMGQLAALVLLNGRLRNKSYKQTIVVGGGDTNVVDDLNGINSTKIIKIVKRNLPDDVASLDDKSNKKPRV
ncbi:hypothetical protein NCAS_0H01570 [Naumovozyma castellii]|uniref:Uncharacterized protein n=1 Tax=Naumovozyma castellii TaxID=27288 RepID=G0VIZ0_NAUCA|nr:hypothetical protein NCAS_0H01570 [Naumovozyma castellii CBS 4309]CCC71467.1 hypothetical protein NCAS_0H01570 [Naumovozyma castellii CBS 4309]